MTALVIDLDRVRRSVRLAEAARDTRENAVNRTLRKIAAEARDRQTHAANMAAIAALAYNARLRRHVSAYEAPDGQGGAA